MLKIFQDTHYQFRDQIRKLYLETFSKGDAAQYLDPDDVDSEIKLTYEEGMMMVAVDDTELTGALFVYPLHYDARFTPELSDVTDKVHTPYISELMVQEKYRGRGLGRRLLLKTLLHLRHNRFSNVFIRVWNENLTALNLYTKSGFKKVGQILQMKWFPDRKSKMIMEKFYLSRGL